jgi:hypothetical protein
MFCKEYAISKIGEENELEHEQRERDSPLDQDIIIRRDKRLEKIIPFL